MNMMSHDNLEKVKQLVNDNFNFINDTYVKNIDKFTDVDNVKDNIMLSYSAHYNFTSH